MARGAIVSHDLNLAGLSAFAGYFTAMGLVSLAAAVALRSVASAAYSALMAVMVAVMVFSIPPKDYWTPAGQVWGHSVLVALLLTSTVVFAFSLLRSWRFDRTMAWVVTAILLANVPLIFCEKVLGAWWLAHFYFVDQVAYDALLVALIVLGVRAYSLDRAPVAAIYLAAFILPAIGGVLNDLASNKIISDPFRFTFEFGVAWEATFFAAAVTVSNRTIVAERDRFERLARVDGLTGVANRRTFDEELARMWGLAWRAYAPVAIVMIDIDFFKNLNDERGHLAGDDCLRRVASLCEGTLRRSGDCFARYGGEEFASVLFNADIEAAAALAERVRAAVERDGAVTVSAGVASAIPRHGGDAATLLARADGALYAAKNEGRNRVSIADDPGSALPTDRRLEKL